MFCWSWMWITSSDELGWWTLCVLFEQERPPYLGNHVASMLKGFQPRMTISNMGLWLADWQFSL